MPFHNSNYQREYIHKYKQSLIGKYSIKISDIKRKGRFYYNLTSEQMPLTTTQFIDIMFKFNGCACCGSQNDIVPMLYKKLNHGGLISFSNTLPCCKSCLTSYYKRKVVSFDTWYCNSAIFDFDKYDQILAHIEKE